MQKSGKALKVNFLLLFIKGWMGASMVVIKGSTDLSTQVCFLQPCLLTIASVILALIYRKQLKPHRYDYIKAETFSSESAYSAHTLRRLSELCLRCLERATSSHPHTAYLYRLSDG